MTLWEDVDSCWGFYGREYAEEAAREALAEHITPDGEPGDSTLNHHE